MSPSPIFNLTIKLVNHTTEFNEGPLRFPSIDRIEMWGLAIHYARALEGNWQVTKQGYLTRPFHNEKEELPLYETTLDIDDSISGLHVLQQLLNGKLKDSEERPHIHIHYGDRLSYIRVDEKGDIYLDNVNVRRGWESDQALAKWQGKQRKTKVTATA